MRSRRKEWPDSEMTWSHVDRQEVMQRSGIMAARHKQSHIYFFVAIH